MQSLAQAQREISLRESRTADAQVCPCRACPLRLTCKCVSSLSQYLATADDDGMVKLFNYPVVVDDAPHRAYRGHCSHVMGVRFNKDDSLVRGVLCALCSIVFERLFVLLLQSDCVTG